MTDLQEEIDTLKVELAKKDKNLKDMAEKIAK